MSEIQCKMSNSLNVFQEMVAMADFLDKVNSSVSGEDETFSDIGRSGIFKGQGGIKETTREGEWVEYEDALSL